MLYRLNINKRAINVWQHTLHYKYDNRLYKPYSVQRLYKPSVYNAYDSCCKLNDARFGQLIL